MRSYNLLSAEIMKAAPLLCIKILGTRCPVETSMLVCSRVVRAVRKNV